MNAVDERWLTFQLEKNMRDEDISYVCVYVNVYIYIYIYTHIYIYIYIAFILVGRM